MLFRYSALTFNGHRIHYDLDYCRNVEGYANPVIHGPLIATLLANLAESISRRRLRQFSYRLLAPALLGSAIVLEAEEDGGVLALRARVEGGSVCAEATALV